VSLPFVAVAELLAVIATALVFVNVVAPGGDGRLLRGRTAVPTAAAAPQAEPTGFSRPDEHPVWG
jgi:hypothetical protein